MNNGEWISLNDLGHLENGKLVIDGRADDVIISGGENISLVRLEKFLEEKFPGNNFLAVGVSDEKWGQVLALLGESEFPENLESEIEAGLGKIYIPKICKVVNQIPLIGIGKFDRKAALEVILSK
jgi:O-succinylbenzoic acid--CoA ligase